MNESLLLLAQNEKIINWFTPLWILSAGAALGLILVLIFLGIVVGCSKIPGLNRLAENRVAYIIASVLLSAGLFSGCAYLLIMTFRLENLLIASSENPQEPAAMLAVVFALAASMIVGFGFWKLVSQRRIDEVFTLLGEGFLSWITIICTSLAGFAAVGLILGIFNGFGVVKFVEDPRGMLTSIGRLSSAGLYTEVFEIAPTGAEESGTPVKLGIEGSELRALIFSANQDLQVSFDPISISMDPQTYFRVAPTVPDKPFVYFNQAMFPEEQIEELYIANRGVNPAQVTLTWALQPKYPEVSLVLWAGGMILGLYVLYLSLAIMMPKIAAISLSTFKTEISQPIFMVILLLSLVFIMLSIWIPYNTLGEDIKMYKDSGLTLIRVVGIFAAIWAASKSVSEEIEGRTALTVLSKPVGRRQFILGKISGISLSMALLFIVLGVWFFFWVSYKPIYDAREVSGSEVEWTNCFTEATHMLPALVLAFMEVFIFVAISVAISTRLGILSNLMICFSIYVLGHLTPLIVMSNQMGGAFDTVKFFGQFVSIIFPVLNHFDVQTAINTNGDVPWIYLGWSFVYTLLYGSVSVLLALVMFEDRDLA